MQQQEPEHMYLRSMTSVKMLTPVGEIVMFLTCRVHRAGICEKGPDPYSRKG